METLLILLGLCSFVLLAFMGYSFLSAGITEFRFQNALKKRGISTMGRVVKIREEKNDDRTTLYPTFSYTINGYPHEAETHAMSAFNPFDVGQEVTLHYLPEKPEVCTWRRNNNEGYLLVGLGVFVLVMFIWILVK